MLMMFSLSLELMIYGGPTIGVLLMYLFLIKLSPPDYTLLPFMVMKDVVMVLWMLDTLKIMDLMLHLMISQQLLMMILLIHV